MAQSSRFRADRPGVLVRFLGTAANGFDPDQRRALTAVAVERGAAAKNRSASARLSS